MKKIVSTVSTVVLVFLLMAGIPVAGASPASPADEPEASIIYPSDAESTIAAGRDFYVIARCAQQPVSATVLLLDEAGKTVREITSGYTDFFTDYEDLVAFNTEYDGYFMPDLLYDPADPNSLTYAYRKCYVKNEYVIALVTGGNWEGIAAHLDKNGDALEKLAAGKYSLRVDFQLADGKTVQCQREMTLGVTENKIISRFSPDYHFENVKQVAAEMGYRLYLDPLPGYWSPAGHFGDGSSYFAEILASWQFADASEYQEGNVYFYLYNVSESSATNSVEVATMQKRSDMAERLRIFCYDYGEPGITYTDFTGQEKALSCGFVEISDPLTFNRMQLEKSVPAEDNAYDVTARLLMDVDTEQADGYACAIGDTLSFFGTITPLQKETVKTLEYVFTKDGRELLRESRSPGLVRQLDTDWFATSVYEFSHSFAVPDSWEGELSVSVHALNETGQPVEGGAESFTLTVSADGTAFRDVSSRRDDAGAIYLLASKGVVVGTGQRYYEPERPVTTAELLTMLGRAAGVAPYGAWYEAYVDWAAEKGIKVDDLSAPVPRNSEILTRLGLSGKIPAGEGNLTRAEAAQLAAGSGN